MLPMSEDLLPFEKVSIEDAKKVLEAETGLKKVEEKDWRWARKWRPPELLKEPTAVWLSSLPREVRPADLPQAYPRIANRLCDLWPHPEMCEQYFEQLLNDRSRRRSGFPKDVLAELQVLQQFRARPNMATGLWDIEATRRR
jgi:hypothetical protein